MRIGITTSSLALAAGIAATTAGVARQQPAANTEIFVAAVTSPAAGGGLEIGPLTNISVNAGYDNQPSFLPDGSAVLFTSNRDGKQTDIYRYDLASRATSQLTRTAESEYSALVTPDGRTFSVIRVEADGTQRLWRFDLDGTNPRLVLEHVKPVGYHVWIDATHLALFVLGGQGQPNTLQVADTARGTSEVIESGIGRSLLRQPGTGSITFVSMATDARRTIKSFDPRTRAVTTLVETADERGQDAAWDPGGTLFMTSGTRLMSWRPGQAGWTQAIDLSSRGVTSLTRLAFGAGPRGSVTLALVAEPASR